MKILVTAFEPFGGSDTNPALEALRQLPNTIGGAAITRLPVPVTFFGAAETVVSALRADDYAAVLCIGQAGGRARLTIERIAINIDDACIADNAGKTPRDETIEPDGPAAYFSTLPLRAIVSGITAAGLPAAISDSAGTFVCNHLMYSVLHFLAREQPQTVGGFMHVPFVPAQVAALKSEQPSMSAADITRGITAAVAAIADSCRATVQK